MPDVRIADVDLSLRLPSGNWDGFFPPAKEKVKGFLDFDYGETPLKFHGPTLDRSQRKITMCCPIDNDGCQFFSVPALIKNSAFLAGLISKDYRSIHSAGFILKSKGILLIGKSGCGKSTLVSLFPDAKVLDDEILLTDGRKMIRCSYYYSNTMLAPNHNLLESSIDYIFILNKQKVPDALKPINTQELSHSITFDDRLPEAFLEPYKGKSRIKVSSPIYELGTKCEPRKSKELIESVLMDNK
jgi:hypothetical protein